MDSYIKSTLTSLFLLQYALTGGLGAAINITITSPSNLMTGSNINLTIEGNVSDALVTWTVNETTIITFFNTTKITSKNYEGRVDASLNDQLVITNAMKTDSGQYKVSVNKFDASSGTGSSSFQLKVYDPVQNVTVVLLPQINVSENTPEVNLSCKAATGGETFTWLKNGAPLPANYSYTLLDGNRTLQIKSPNITYNGNYTCIVSNPVSSSNNTIELIVKQIVRSVTVELSPPTVYENTPDVSLFCKAATGGETFTWLKNGAPLPANYSYTLLDGNRTLQIKSPNITYNGNYTCIVSNPVSSSNNTIELIVYPVPVTSLSAGAIAGIVVGSVCGGILLIAFIILIVCCVKRRKGKKEKQPVKKSPTKKNPGGPNHKDVLRTVSGNTLSPDDPAFFTVNNIMYRNSSLSMGSYNMDQQVNRRDVPGTVWNTLESNRASTPNSRISSNLKPKSATQV
ncbi:carcinoembryonic antigen-related cell adhesion molecule 1-like [Pelobates cultripes]|uniref:Carcinoembryonic antigen-related cell adhesion molecule 1-like n=1 Tax=Pelobates cultripes TaxID=61616 RepID=A0AAD1T4M5_PELCU|nr:carcinoembryonic antigen-related cell adhesion molecule 1-like [Pelobates cultripes]